MKQQIQGSLITISLMCWVVLIWNHFPNNLLALLIIPAILIPAMFIIANLTN